MTDWDIVMVVVLIAFLTMVFYFYFRKLLGVIEGKKEA